jgi:uncharacterized membrane protein YkvA (DUF1232 family)
LKIYLHVLQWVRRLKRNVLAIWFACQHPGTPLIAKVLAVLVAGYAFSPIDLIPDFIPFVGYVDDFVLLPGAVYVLFKLIPRPVLDECHLRADAFLQERRRNPRSYIAGAVILLLWAGLLWWLWAQFGDAVTAWMRGWFE